MAELTPLTYLWTYWHARFELARDDENGAPLIEWIIIAATMAGLAIAVTAIVSSKVTSKAESIPTE